MPSSGCTYQTGAGVLLRFSLLRSTSLDSSNGSSYFGGGGGVGVGVGLGLGVSSSSVEE